MCRCDDRPQQTHRYGIDRTRLQILYRIADIGLVERNQLVAARIESTAHLACAVTRHERLGIVEFPIEGPFARRLAQSQDVRMALVTDQADPCRPAFDKRVRRNSGAVNDRAGRLKKRAEIRFQLICRQTERFHETALERRRGRCRLIDFEAPFASDHAVGKRAANVDANGIAWRQTGLPLVTCSDISENHSTAPCLAVVLSAAAADERIITRRYVP